MTKNQAIVILTKLIEDLENTYKACERDQPEISIGQFRRLSEAKALLRKEG